MYFDGRTSWISHERLRNYYNELAIHYGESLLAYGVAYDGILLEADSHCIWNNGDLNEYYTFVVAKKWVSVDWLATEIKNIYEDRPDDKTIVNCIIDGLWDRYSSPVEAHFWLVNDDGNIYKLDEDIVEILNKRGRGEWKREA